MILARTEQLKAVCNRGAGRVKLPGQDNTIRAGNELNAAHIVVKLFGRI